MLTTNKQRVNQVYECVKEFHKLETLPTNDLPCPQNTSLLPILRPYQVKAVEWMLYKELYESYYESYEENNPTSKCTVQLPKGGILADEMGLGKTVEMLACILSNPRQKDIATINDAVNSTSLHDVRPSESEKLSTPNDSDDAKPLSQRILESGLNSRHNNSMSVKSRTRLKRKRKTSTSRKFKSSAKHSGRQSVATVSKPKKSRGEVYTKLKEWYENVLLQSSPNFVSKKKVSRKSTFQCCCMNDMHSDAVVECPGCKTWQHQDCVGYDKHSAEYDYYCFQCWLGQPLVVSAGTVIVSPEAISQQWVSEIEKHVKKDKLKILVYEGVRVTGYIQPNDLASYDIVLITYQVLTRELNYTKAQARTLRHDKRFHAPTTPLLFVEWWRLCLDEAQMVEGSSCLAAEMAKKFSAINKWAITGTPIQKAVNDLIGLMEFLAGKENPEFYDLMHHDWRSLLKLVPRMLWRTQKKDVLEEAGVPPQTEQTHMLEFSGIEKYFYQCTHNECSHQFLTRVNKVVDLNVTVKRLDRKLVGRLLNPLLKLRQACLHPQAVRGKFVSIKKTMTMEDLVTQMCIKAKLDAEQSMREFVSSLNGIAALEIIIMNWLKAANIYRVVLAVDVKYCDRLKMDSLQKIHAMHNLLQLLDGGYEGVDVKPRELDLRHQLAALESHYLGKREVPIRLTEARLKQHREAIADSMARSPSKTLGYSEWFLRLLEWSEDREELLDRLKSAIQNNDVEQKNQYNNLAKKFKSLHIVRAEVAKWLADMDITRIKALNWLAELQAADKESLASEALICHLNQATITKKGTRCKLCEAETVLKKYEAMLFEDRSKAKRKKNNSCKPGTSTSVDDTTEMDNKEITQLNDVNVNTFESSKKGGFKESPFEKVLKALVAYGRQKCAPSVWSRQASDHLNLLAKVKKEFLDVNLLWRQICDYVDAKDELNMCKTRLRLPDAEEVEEIKANNKKVIENPYIILPYRVVPEHEKFIYAAIQSEKHMKKKICVLSYLGNLQKEGTPEIMCPICRNDLIDKWAVMECGHSVCLDCMSLLRQHHMQSVGCPQCRQTCDFNNVSYVEKEPSSNQDSLYSTKVNAVIQQTLLLTKQHHGVKILVFSLWEKVLDLLAEAFEENKITFRRLRPGKFKHQAIKEFKTGDVSVLILPLRSGAKGLNLVEATHVFLVEPILNPAEELQAVGRVHRIGQTRPTVVHRFIVRETVEERILAAMVESGADQWSDDCLTIQKVYDLFMSSTDTSLTEHLIDTEPSNVVSSSSSEDESDNDNNTE